MESKLPSLLIGAAVMVVLGNAGSFIPVPVLNSCIGCAGLLAGGLLAVYHYTNKERLTLTSGQGAVMGLQTGVAGLILGMLIGLVVWLFMGMPSMGDFMMDRMRNSPQQMTPEQLDKMEEVFSSSYFPIIIFGSATVMYLLAGLIGGLIGASVFKKGGPLQPEQTY